MKPNSPEEPSSFLSDALLTTRFESEDYFHRWVGISAWLLLVVYEGEDVAFGEDEPSDWSYFWPRAEQVDPNELREYLEFHVFPDLEKLQGTGHPLALVPAALRSVPDGPLMSLLQRAKDCYEPGTTPPLDELYPIWNRWEDASVPSLEGGAGMIPWNLSCFLSKTLAATPDNRVADLHARTGTLGGEMFESSKHLRELVLFEQNPSLAVIAAMRAILRGQQASKLQVHVCSPWEASDKVKSKFDVVVAVPPWGAIQTDHRGKRNRTRSEYLYAESAMDMLADGGRAVIVVPQSFLFSDSSRELRKRMINEFRLDLVVNVPGKTIFKADVKAAILYFSRKPAKTDVWIVSEDEYQLINPDGYSDSPEFESLEAAILARQGLFPKLKDENERPMAFNEWLDHRLGDLVSDENPEGFLPGSPEHRLLRTASLFQAGPTAGEIPETGFLVTRETIQKRAFELLPPKGSASDYEAFISQAVERFGARVCQLGEIAEMRRGKHFRPDQIIKEYGFLGDDVGLVRPSDLPKSFIKSPFTNYGSVKLTPEASSSVKSEELLQEDDILICLLGDSGKVSLSKPETLIGGPGKIVASDRIAVVRIRNEFKSSVNAYFTAALIGSTPYREAMLAQSRGSTIRQLHVSDLKEIVIPIFPPAERTILMGALNEGGTSLDSLLSALEVRPKSNEAIRCFSNAPEWRSFSELPLGAPVPEVRAALAHLIATRGSEIIQQRNEPEDSFLPWMRLFVDSAKDLEQILSYPPGTDQLAALYGWRASVRDPNRPFRAAWNHLVNSLYQDSESIRNTVRHRCDRLFARVSSLSIMAVDALLENIELTATIDPQSVPAGLPAETSITILNRGPLPLRKLRLRGDGLEDRELPILPSGSAHSWNMNLKSLPPGRHIVHVAWNALRLDDRTVGGEMELAIDVSNTLERTGLLDLGESPYVYARVLDEKTENVFFGRSRAIQQIRSAISRPSASTIVLVEGNRRIGKTSLLKFFIRHHLPSDKVPVFINFQEFDGESGSTARPGIPTRKVFEGMAKELVDSAMRAFPGLELPELGKAPEGNNPFRMKVYSAAAASLIDPEAPFASFRQLAEIIRTQIQPKSLLLIFDEFDRLQEGIESGITSDQVPENLRHLFQSWNDVSGIFTGSRTIRRLRQEYWNILFGLGETVRLSGLDLDEARGLIVEPVKGRLVYAPKAVDEICRLTARQPLIIQGICERIFRECNESGRRLIDFSMVETIASRFAEENEHFESIWGYVGSDRKRLITFLIEQQEAATGGATFEQLRDLLEECRLRVTVRELHGDLEDLEDLEVIGKQQQTGIAKYRIEIPLFARWLRLTKDFSEFRAAAQEE